MSDMMKIYKENAVMLLLSAHFVMSIYSRITVQLLNSNLIR